MRAILLLLPLAFLLQACTQQADSPSEQQAAQRHQAYIQKLIPPAKDAAARQFLDLLRRGDIASAQQMAGPMLHGPGSVAMLQQVHDMLPQGDLLDIAPIGFDKRMGTYDQQTIYWYLITYQLHFNGRWYVADVSIDTPPESNTIVGTRITFYNGYETSVAFNRFTFAGRGWRDWAAYLLCVGTPLFIIGVTVICAMSPVRRKWLWIVFILLGIVQFRYEWTRGIVEVNPLSVLLLGSGYQRANVYSPLILQWAIPVGAFTFLILRRKLIESKSPVPSKRPKKRRSRG